MKINEICQLIGITKKAINYYEKQGLISPSKNDNSYREYTAEELKKLKEIALYRKLDLSTKEIKGMLNSNNKREKLNELVIDKQAKIVREKLQERYLKLLLGSEFSEEELDRLSEEFTREEMECGYYISSELKRCFPSGLGILISVHFAPYLKGPIDTLEKHYAWLRIVEFLDSIEDIKIPEIITEYYDALDEETLEKMGQISSTAVQKLASAGEEELEEYKKDIMEYVDRVNAPEISSAMEAVNKVKKEMKKVFESSGYYDVFIPNMKILSEEYKRYHEKLIIINEKLTEELGIKYDENMNIVREGN